jgi:serine protease Do
MRLSWRLLLALVLAGALVGAAASGAQAQSAGKAARGYLGVTIQDVTEELSQSLPRGVHEGAIVNGVMEDSPAEEAGLQEGDVIVKFDQTRVRTSGDLTTAVRNAEPGHTALIEYYREGQRMRAEVKLAEQEMMIPPAPGAEYKKQMRREARRHGTPDEQEYIIQKELPRSLAFMMADAPRLGVQLVDLTDQLSRFFGVKSGVLVSEVIEGSAADTAGFKAGDIIVAVAGEPTGSAEEVRDELRDVERGPVEITVMRGGKESTLTAELKKPHRSSLSGFYAPSAPMFNVPEVGMDQEEFRAQMDELREELQQLRKELSDMRREMK